MNDPNPCRIIGVLDDGVASLTPAALAYIRQADVVIGAARTLALLGGEFKAQAQTHDLGGQLRAVPDWVRQAREQQLSCVVLATGDPLCFGIAPFLAARLCSDALEVLPNVSTLQLACARLGMAWQNARLMSVHAQDAGPWQQGAGPAHGLYALAQAVHAHDRLLVLTSPANTPARIAQLLEIEGLADQVEMAVAENLLQPDERIYPQLTVAQAATMTFAALNVVAIWRVAPRGNPVLMGLDDEDYCQRRPRGDGSGGLITKQEVRAVSLARLQLRADSVVWDIGAGSGSVGLEAARLCWRGHVWAIEKNAHDIDIIRQNHAAFGVANYTLVHDRAPSGMADWPDPDAVFIGGSGGELAELIERALRRLKPGGRLVMNFVTLENIATALETLKRLQQEPALAMSGPPSSDPDGSSQAAGTTAPARALHWDVLQLQAARSRPILQMNRLAAENPVWLLSAAWRPVADAPADDDGRD
ncbi:MAG: precorrin-6y C5,15-methyltransferase (decarboxylating) subunit CbiE [Lautropia sp.]|nr:precorrin-6y C5,15-methyltransferase (decarboxylating) subunit CbiE [Lautropia sp.]